MDAGLTRPTADAAEQAALPLAREVAELIRQGLAAAAVAKLADLDRAAYAQTLHTARRILAGQVA